MPQFNATFLFVLLSFFVFMLLMKAVFFDPLLRIKTAREQQLEGDKVTASSAADEWVQLRHRYEDGLKEARKAAYGLIQESSRHAKTEAQAIVQTAKQQAQQQIDAQLQTLQSWRDNAYQDLQQERAALAQLVVERVSARSREGVPL